MLITGCSSGFGKALCSEFTAQGYYVIATARNVSKLADVKADMKVELDVSDENSISKAMRLILSEIPKIDILIKNAGWIKGIKIVSYIIAAIRGLLDIVENSIMINQIYSFPNVSYNVINACNVITRLKFHFMRGWIVCFILMIILERVSRKKGDR